MENVEAAGGRSNHSVTVYWRTRGGFDSVEMSLGDGICLTHFQLKLCWKSVQTIAVAGGESSVAAQNPMAYAVGPPDGWASGWAVGP